MNKRFENMQSLKKNEVDKFFWDIFKNDQELSLLADPLNKKQGKKKRQFNQAFCKYLFG